MEERIQIINDTLASIGSKYHTDDGRTVIRHVGGLRFIRRTFESVEKLEEAMETAKLFSLK